MDGVAPKKSKFTRRVEKLAREIADRETADLRKRVADLESKANEVEARTRTIHGQSASQKEKAPGGTPEALCFLS
jgi:hypothetical protein